VNIRTKLTIVAGIVIVVLTGAAFWLSYAHLQEVADAHGLDGARSWAWPATLDLFIVAGEILMLVSALKGKRDPWAIALTVAGSVGSVALNVYGVGSGAPTIEYIVAAVPPTAALLAFGALMHQVLVAVQNGQEAVDEAPAQESDPVLEEAQEAVEAVSPVPSVEEIVEVSQIHNIHVRPSAEDIAAAVEDIRSGGREPSGALLAQYFGVSDRTGRRYLNLWKETVAA